MLEKPESGQQIKIDGERVENKKRPKSLDRREFLGKIGKGIVGAAITFQFLENLEETIGEFHNEQEQTDPLTLEKRERKKLENLKILTQELNEIKQRAGRNLPKELARIASQDLNVFFKKMEEREGLSIDSSKSLVLGLVGAGIAGIAIQILKKIFKKQISEKEKLSLYRSFSFSGSALSIADDLATEMQKGPDRQSSENEERTNDLAQKQKGQKAITLEDILKTSAVISSVEGLLSYSSFLEDGNKIKPEARKNLTSEFYPAIEQMVDDPDFFEDLKIGGKISQFNISSFLVLLARSQQELEQK
ncbi:MAG: hypothetical protein AAB585_00100 [Patescibacteria group bacterium]